MFVLIHSDKLTENITSRSKGYYTHLSFKKSSLLDLFHESISNSVVSRIKQVKLGIWNMETF